MSIIRTTVASLAIPVAVAATLLTAGTASAKGLECQDSNPVGPGAGKYTSCFVDRSADGSGRIFWEQTGGTGWDVTTLDGQFIIWAPEVY